jgi:cysteine desulfurase/selenocysteine lyase
MFIPGLLSQRLREDFPLLRRNGPTGKPLVYLDNAATTLKPRAVIQAVSMAMERHTGNVHRAVHVLGDEATELLENARQKVAHFIGAQAHEIVWVRNATEGMNLVARCFPRKGRVLVSYGEHHSNLFPWGNDRVKRLPPRKDGSVDEAAFLRELEEGDVALVVVSHVANVTGSLLDVRRLADAVHGGGALLVLDGAQSVPHCPVDVQQLDCDFLVFSSHKMCGPTGIGALYGKAACLSELEWYLHGGGTVEEVSQGRPVARQTPWRLEAGTPPIEAAIGFGAAVDYLQEIGMQKIANHERTLLNLALGQLADISGVRVLGLPTANHERIGPVSFTVAATPAHVIARGLSDGFGICVRSGFHCAQPLHDALRSPPSVRLSFYVYNQPWELEFFFDSLAQFVAVGCGM